MLASPLACSTPMPSSRCGGEDSPPPAAVNVVPAGESLVTAPLPNAAGPPPASLLEGFCRLSRHEQAQRIHKEFAKLSKLDRVPSDDTRMFATASLPRHASRNRYLDVLANEETLFPPADSGVYINANFISKTVLGIDRDFIASQAPVLEHIEEFWDAMVLSGASLIVNLTRFRENGRPKADPYWPATGGIGACKTFGKAKITLIDEKCDPSALINIRVVEHQPSGRTFEIAHYTGWPDMGVPASADCFRSLIALIEASPRDRPTVVHCSAGLGRTGTLIAVYALRQYHLHSLLTDASVFQVVSKLKSLRCGMVQRREQLAFVYQYIVEEAGTSL